MLSESAYCPTPDYALAKLRLEGIITARGTSAKGKNKLLRITEEGTGMMATGIFEKIVSGGADAGLYLKDVQTHLLFPLEIAVSDYIPTHVARSVTGLRIKDERTVGVLDSRKTHRRSAGSGIMRVVPTREP